MFNQTANTQITDNIKTDLILKEGADVIPTVVNPSIQPTYEVNQRYCDVVRQTGSTSTGTITVFTTPSDRDFFLTGMRCDYAKDATCDMATGGISCQVTINGTARNIHGFSVITLTAQSSIFSIDFSTPIKLDRNTAITMGGTFTVGVCVREIGINGYTNSPSQPPQRVNF